MFGRKLPGSGSNSFVVGFQGLGKRLAADSNEEVVAIVLPMTRGTMYACRLSEPNDDEM